MASLCKEGQKRWRVQWMCIAGSGKRMQIRLSGLTRKQAASHFARIESIISTRKQGAKLDDFDAAWIGGLPDSFHDKLTKAGLMEPRVVKAPEPEEPVVRLGGFLDEFEEDGLTAKGESASQSTRKKWRASMDYLKRHLGSDRAISTITHEDAHQFRKWLDSLRIKKTKQNPKGQPLAENSRRKHMDCAKVFFNAAKRRGLILFNPFEYQVSSTKKNRDRDFFLQRETTERIIEACPDAQWRLLLALWRYAGLRKMEVMWLTWDDVLWDQGKLRVQSPKTRHHEGKEIRYVPLRDIRKYLDAVFAEAEEGTIDIITRFSESNTNLDKPFNSILHRAGLVPWPKLFQNMRSSCETDWLNEGHPAHVVAAWIGHSVKVQRDSYAQITDGHFDAFNNHRTEHQKSGSTDGSDEVRIDENSRELSEPSVEPFPRKTQKTPKNTGFPGLSSSGGGTRTPDTRIMIPLL